MDKYEFNIKVEQIKKLMKKKDFGTAVKIADTIDWERVKENQLLIMAADVYEIAGKYDSAREVLLLAYEKTGLGRQLAYRLCRLSVKRGDNAEAEEFYQEFTTNSPRDAGKYILQYEMSKGKGEPVDNQIRILETYIEEDMDDRWAYELAKLYHKAHLRDKCVELCDTIILWFADGKYVEKALELKQLYVPLSENQRIKYEAQKSRRAEVRIDAINADESVSEPIEENVGENIAQNITDVAEAEKPLYEEKKNGDVLDEVHEADIDVNSIHVKDYSENNKYDTVNLQMELAKSVSSLFDNTVEIFKPAVKREEAAEQNDNQEDDQIEGQMNLEEVLAMFESGELSESGKEEPVKEPAEEPMEESVEEVAEEPIEEPVEELVEEPIEEPAEKVAEEPMEEPAEELVEEPIEEPAEEVAEEPMEESVEEYVEGPIEEMAEESTGEYQEEVTGNDVSETIETEAVDSDESNMEVNGVEEIFADDMPVVGMSEEEILAEIISREIQFDIEEELTEEGLTEEEPAEDEQTEEQTEEHSGDAELEIQENSSLMFDLKNNDTEEIIEDIGADVETESLEESEIETEPEPEDESEGEVRVERPVIQSSTAKEELKKFIARFVGVQGLDKQILKVMQTTLKTDVAPTKFILVKGEVKSGKTTLAIEVIKLANKLMQRRGQKIAKIKAQTINGKSIDALLEKLDGCDVLIERVSDMEPETYKEFIDKIQAEQKLRFVIFEDEISLADAYLQKVPEGYKEFANILEIRQNKIKDWTKIAQDYAKTQGYSLDEMGVLALSAKIDRLRAITLVVHKNHVEQLVDGAIAKASKFSLRKLFRQEKDDDGNILLTEKDFAE